LVEAKEKKIPAEQGDIGNGKEWTSSNDLRKFLRNPDGKRSKKRADYSIGKENKRRRTSDNAKRPGRLDGHREERRNLWQREKLRIRNVQKAEPEKPFRSNKGGGQSCKGTGAGVSYEWILEV